MFRLPFMSLIATSVLTSCLVSAPAHAQEKTLRIAAQSDLRVLDPYVTTAGITDYHAAAILDELFAWDANLQPQPQMAEDYTLSDDKLTYRISLRPGLKFHDGSPVTARDAVASLKRLIAVEKFGLLLAPYVKEVVALDDRSLEIRLKEPMAATLFLIGGANNHSGVMREKDIPADPATPVRITIGSGPFRFVEDQSVSGAKYIYLKNKDYVPRADPASAFAGGKVVNIDRVELLNLPDSNTAFAALRKGEVDLIDNPSLDQVKSLEGDPNITLGTPYLAPSTGVLRPNSLFPPFNDARAREALAYMVNQEEYGAVAFGDRKNWSPCFSYWFCGTPDGTTAGSEPYQKQDLAKARQLMQEAGYKGEPIVLLAGADIPAIAAQSLLTAENLRKIGVKVDLRMIDWGTLVGVRAKKDPPSQGGWHLFHTLYDGPAAASPVFSNVTTMNCDAGYVGWACSKDAEALRKAIFLESDPAKRRALVDDYSRLLWREVPTVLTTNYVQIVPWRASVKNVVKAPIVLWYNLTKD